MTITITPYSDRLEQTGKVTWSDSDTGSGIVKVDVFRMGKPLGRAVISYVQYYRFKKEGRNIQVTLIK